MTVTQVETKGSMTTVRASILIVDDQPDNLRTLSAILDGQGYKVRKAISGLMALETVRADPPNLILLDIRMPHMNGYEVCTALKAAPETRQIPVIFLSALSETVDKVKAFSTGGVDYITKPFQAEEVLVRIRHQITIQQQQQQLRQEIQERRNAEAIVRQLNDKLELLVQERTAQLQRSLEFESLLKRITDKVRDSLDEEQILQTAVQELADGLNIACCTTEIYDTGSVTAIDPAASDRCPFSFINYVDPKDSLGLYHQLLQKQAMQFCELEATATPTNFQKQAILICPIFDDQGRLGNLRLFKPPADTFDELEIRLVRQVANQCAIAIRQARLYQEAQKQVEELQRLNQLKDDFLSTISHELRSPIANVKMVTRLLITMATQGQDVFAQLSDSQKQDNKVIQYLQVLQNECERELHLIEDLLDLQHLNAGVYPLERSAIDLYHWISYISEPFKLMTQNQQQTLETYLAPNLPILVTDVSCLTRIVTELLNNACKYTPPEGMITITVTTGQQNTALAKRQDREPQGYTNLLLGQAPASCPFPPASADLVSAPTLILSVINTGVEIPVEEQTRIFDKFYRIPSHDPWKHGGTGLGLALIKRIVEYLTGSIHVLSASGQTCFTVELPFELAIPSNQPSIHPHP